MCSDRLWFTKRRLKTGWFLSLLFAHLSFLSSAQLITGRVFDAESREPIPYANVYFNNSQTGASTDNDGNFRLNAARHAGESIVVSCVGYASGQIATYSPANKYLIYLTPQATLLKEVLVMVDDLPRELKMGIFLSDFIGQTPNAIHCTIENQNELKLVYEKSTRKLKAFCYEPLMISNKSLGYKITYYLDEFTKDSTNLFFQGNSIFADDTTGMSSRDWRRIMKKRQQTYLGSYMHFFRSLWTGHLQEEGFEVWNRDTRRKVTVADIVKVEGDSIRFLSCDADLVINYLPRREATYLNFKPGNRVFFTRRGYFDPQSLTWEGSMARRRMADLLPMSSSPDLHRQPSFISASLKRFSVRGCKNFVINHL